MFLEYVVRPYQTPDAQGRIIIPSTPIGTRERATLTWGAKATMPPVNTGINVQTQCCQETADEKDRSNHTVRITGPDGESYVDVDRAYKMSLSKKEQNNCSDDWAQDNGVAQEIRAENADWAAYFAENDKSSGTNNQCALTWNLSG